MILLWGLPGDGPMAAVRRVLEDEGVPVFFLDQRQALDTLIYKSISGVRSIVSHLKPEHAGRLERLRWCPTQFQQHVPGEDYRVHVMGEEAFAARIVSSADDYRYASRQQGHTRIERAGLSEDVLERCRRMARAMELPVAGSDLRRTPEGEWYCFEVNPSPGFTYYQEATGYEMDRAVARLLRGGR